MAIFHKLFGGRGQDAYQQGVTLFEQGRAAEAIPLLEPVFQQDPGSPRGSLAGLYLRQALVSEGRRLLQAGDAEAAADLLARATQHWAEFPDLQFLAGAAAALARRWGAALESARQALRRNPDYCEARLLEACALQALDRPREAKDSFEALIESGRRIDHWLLLELGAGSGQASVPLPADLLDHLRRAVLGDEVKLRLAEAVALCRSGEWDEGLAVFARLGRQHPRYPDIRAKHAAALYQTGQSAAALTEAEAALAINPRYRTAVSLKGLILAEQGQVLAAHEFLADAIPRADGTAGRHEELFLAYLRAVLALLLGDFAACRQHLADWHDLPRQFARAALLLAACDDLAGLPDAALRRLEELVEVWMADAELHFLRGALLLQQRQWPMVANLLAQWPGGRKGLEDPRPLYLRARLEVAQGRPPVLPPAGPAGSAEPEREDAAASEIIETIAPAAWKQLAVHAALLRGDPGQACHLAGEIVADGAADEETGRLLLLAAAASGQQPPADLAGLVGPADSWGFALCRQLRLQDQGAAAEAWVQRRRRQRPDVPSWSWLATGFWLDPVRRWLG
jgi:tetratricopeptide (TPR) repeat protein